MSTEWTARRSGERILCGRRDTVGRMTCGGELARVMVQAPLEAPNFEWATLEPGTTEDPPGHVRLTTKAARQKREGRRPLGRRTSEALSVIEIPQWRTTAPEPPWTRDCPRCGERNVVKPPAAPPGPWPLPLPGAQR
jgi:hypothetical protein